MTNVKLMVVVFVGIILGAVFIDMLGDRNFDASHVQTVTNESITITLGTGTLANEGFISGIAMHNSTAGGVPTHTSGWANGTITSTYAGALTMAQFPGNGTWNVSYTYGDTTTYVHNAQARTILPLVLVFFALGILLVGAIWVYNSLKDYL